MVLKMLIHVQVLFDFLLMSLRLPLLHPSFPAASLSLLPVNSDQPSVACEAPPPPPHRKMLIWPSLFYVFPPCTPGIADNPAASPTHLHSTASRKGETKKRPAAQLWATHSESFGSRGHRLSAWNTKEEVSLALEIERINGWTEQADGLTGKICSSQKSRRKMWFLFVLAAAAAAGAAFMRTWWKQPGDSDATREFF